MQRHPYNLKRSQKAPQGAKHILLAPRVLLDVQLPTAVDLRAAMPVIYDQGQLGSCSGNAMAGAIQYNNASYTPSRLFIYYNEREEQGTVNQDSGSTLQVGVDTCQKFGAPDESLWPYDVTKFTIKPPQIAYDQAHPDVITTAYQCNNLNDIKRALAGSYPVVIGIELFQSFESMQVAQTGLVPMPQNGEPSLGGHAVIACGYNDTNQHVICRNSWGQGWGDQGYFYLPYSYFNEEFAFDFWAIETVINENKKKI